QLVSGDDCISRAAQGPSRSPSDPLRPYGSLTSFGISEGSFAPEKDYFGLFSNPGGLSSCPCTGRLAVQALGLAGAEGSTPKSQTYRLIWPFSSSSTTAYSPAVSGSSGVSLIHSPTGVAVVLTQFSFWVTLP